MFTTPNRENRTPQRTPHRTPQLTPNRTTPKTLHRLTPHHIASQSRVAFKTVKPPDFTAMARKETSTHNSFFAYNPEKEPIRVRF